MEEGDDHAEFSFKTSLRICAFANFGRQLDARLFIPAALRFASSTSLFAYLIGRLHPPPSSLLSLSLAARKIRTLQNDYLSKRSPSVPSSAILHDFINASGWNKIQTLPPMFFSLSPSLFRPLSLSLFLQVSILISVEYTPSRRRARILRVFL